MQANEIKEFFGRAEELGHLATYLSKPSMLAVTGRRRVGKSRLIREFARRHRLPFYNFQGVSPKADSTLSQIQNFCQKVSVQFGIPQEQFSFPDWNHALYGLADLLKNKQGKKLLLLDEIQWMAQDNDGLLEVLKTVWDDKLQYDDIVVVLCGSVSSWIYDNIINSTNFYGRLKDIAIREMPMLDANQFWSKSPHVAPIERIKTLAIVGGIPKYLEQFNFNNTLEQNIQELCFKPQAFFLEEFDHYFHDSLKSSSVVYRKIIDFLSKGKKTREQIRQHTGVTGTIDDYLNDLKRAGFISEDANFSFVSDTEGSRTFFRLSDNFTRFYLSYIAPRRVRIESGLYKMNRGLEHLPQWSSVVGLQFENLLNHPDNRNLLFHQLGLAPGNVKSASGFVQVRTRLYSAVQIDMMIEDQNNNYWLCEFKFRSSIGATVITEVRRKIDKLKNQYSNLGSIRPVLVYCGELTEDLTSGGFFTHKIDVTSLLPSFRTSSS
jgi:AAA+ ATPase superfamily predicted ATPase